MKKTKTQLLAKSKSQLADMIISLESNFDVDNMITALEDVKNACTYLNVYVDIDTVGIEEDINKIIDTIEQYFEERGE